MNKQIKKYFNNKNILITGGLGSIGSAIVKELLLLNPKNIKVIDNRETGLFYGIYYNKNKKIEYCFIDIRDRESLEKAMKNVDIVFHAAAMKHVLVCERNPFEAVKTNVIGTQNVIEACVNNGIKKMILISTDKAVNPTNVMGASKLLAERIVAAIYNLRNGIDTEFGMVRFGNVLYSRGSVLEIWENQLKEGRKITITDPEMTRFFMGISQTIRLILSATYYAKNSEIFIFKMPSCKISILAEAYLELKGYPSDYYTVTGIKEGEKKHEELLFKEDGKLLMEKNEILLKLPLQLKKINMKYYHQINFKKSKKNTFISNDPNSLLKKDQIKQVLKDFLNKDFI
ncbi:polysaccharide biosynthesis protein [Candidatus Parcubacteria bacterium]|nr:polysaccharide biosynthesis protein [Candidatus Parcubacteria bacterium]